MDKLPVEIHGRVLQPFERVEDVNVADGEVLIFEWKVGVDPENSKPWAFDPKTHVNKKRRVISNSRLPKVFQDVEDEEERMNLPLDDLLTGKSMRCGLTGL